MPDYSNVPPFLYSAANQWGIGRIIEARPSFSRYSLQPAPAKAKKSSIQKEDTLRPLFQTRSASEVEKFKSMLGEP
jgi:hypothetical protein